MGWMHIMTTIHKGQWRGSTDVYLPHVTADERKREQARRARYSNGDTCAVCGKAVTNGKTRCISCAQRGRKRTAQVSPVYPPQYHAGLYAAPLTESFRRALGIPAQVCSLWGTTDCHVCNDDIPAACDGECASCQCHDECPCWKGE